MFPTGLKFIQESQNPASPEFQAKALTAARIAMVERFREDNRQFVESHTQSLERMQP